MAIIGWTIIGMVFCGMLYLALSLYFFKPASFSYIVNQAFRYSVWGGLAGCLLATILIILVGIGKGIRKFSRMQV